MTASPWAWSLFAVYLLVTAALAWRGARRTGGGAAAFAIGSGRMNPWMAGITLGACLASSSLFVIMPGFVYADGLPALLGFGLPVLGGYAVGLWLFAPRFQRTGVAAGALTVPHWLGARYRSPGLRRLFAGLGVLQVAYLVMVVVGCANVMEASLGIPYRGCVVLVVGFVFAYTGFGGAWAHALTNSLQGSVMLVMALVIFASGWRFWVDGSLIADLAASGTVAPGSRLFGSHVEIWLVQFLMCVALTAQPHLLIKALYVDGRRDLGIAIGAGVGVFAVYMLVLFAGAYARLTLADDLPQDKVVAQYLANAFPWPPLGALVSIAIVAASMSTIDGLLVAISASVSGDLLPRRTSLSTDRLVVVGLALVTVAIALDPPDLVLILSQLGVFGFVVASAGPLLAGLYLRRPLSARGAAVSALLALAVHYGLTLSHLTTNPGVGGSAALAVGVGAAFLLSGRTPAAPAPVARPGSSRR